MNSETVQNKVDVFKTTCKYYSMGEGVGGGAQPCLGPLLPYFSSTYNTFANLSFISVTKILQ